MANKRTCQFCGTMQDYREYKTIPGRGTACDLCYECSSCGKRLPVANIGHRGVDGDRSLCKKCHDEKRKEISKIHRKRRPCNPKTEILLHHSRRDFKLWQYARLETIPDSKGCGKFIEFATFETNDFLLISIGSYSPRERKGVIVEGKLVYVVERILEVLSKGETPYGFFQRHFVRGVSLARRLGYRRVARKSRGRFEPVDARQSLTWAQEFESHREEMIDEALPVESKIKMKRLERRHDDERYRVTQLTGFLHEDVAPVNGAYWLESSEDEAA